MTDDATLSDFQPVESDDADGDVVESAEDDATGTAETTAAGETAGGDTDSESETQPAPSADTDSRASTDSSKSTYAWGSYTCTRCERETDRVWRLEGEFVCPDCKSW